MNPLTGEQLKAIAPQISDKAVETFLPYLNKYMPKFQIDTPQRVAGFLSQVLEECGLFKWMEELSSGKQYEGRKDLGNVYAGDGEKFKGRGGLQATGRDMYTKLSHFLYSDNRLVVTPDVVATPELGIASACWIWTTVKNLNKIADQPEDWTFTDDHGKVWNKVQRITYHINGGENGIDVRTKYYQAAIAELLPANS